MSSKRRHSLRLRKLLLTARLLVAILTAVTASASAQPFGYSIMDGGLTRLDLATGDVTELGGVSLAQVGGMTMTRAGELLALHGGSDDLWRIDPSTATAERLGPLGVDVAYGAGLTMDACGDLWLSAGRVLYQVDPATGAATYRADLDDDVVGLTSRGTDLLGLADGHLAEIRRDGRVQPFGDPIVRSSTVALDFDADDRLWAVWWYFSPIIPSEVSQIYEFDPATGALLQTTAAPQLFNRAGWNLAVSPPTGSCAQPVAVPVNPEALGVVSLLLAIAGAGLLARR